MGFITLLVFPIPTFLDYYFFREQSLISIFELDHIQLLPIVLGLGLGVAYAWIALLLMQAPVFEKLPNRIEQLVRRMNLNIFDCIFLSICASVGEELLFRSGVQYYIGPIITSIIFVAIHGYLTPWNWRMSLYGLIVLPFILLISFGLSSYGIWYCIAAHFSYDLVLFLVISKKNNPIERF